LSSVRALNGLSSFPVLGVVGIAFPSAQRKQFRGHLWRFCAATACLLIALGIVLALNWSGARLSIHAVKTLVNS
jgi:hypothetical protein